MPEPCGSGASVARAVAAVRLGVIFGFGHVAGIESELCRDRKASDERRGPELRGPRPCARPWVAPAVALGQAVTLWLRSHEPGSGRCRRLVERGADLCGA